jgi:AcrR family transcriptional regulator
VSTTETSAQTFITRPKRADARRNYEKVLSAARQAFAEGGESTALEEIARRAGVGIGTLYRHFPNRQALLEALYVDEVEEMCRSAAELDGSDPWEALNGWFERFIAYIGTKRALAAELSNYLDQDAPLFQVCRTSLSYVRTCPSARSSRWLSESPRSRRGTPSRTSTSCESPSTACDTRPKTDPGRVARRLWTTRTGSRRPLFTPAAGT